MRMNNELLESLIELGWVFTMYAPDEHQWMKFDKEGNVLGIQGDDTWNKDWIGL